MFHVSVYHARRKHPHTVYRLRNYDSAVKLAQSVMLAEDVTKVDVVWHTKTLGTEHMWGWELQDAS